MPRPEATNVFESAISADIDVTKDYELKEIPIHLINFENRARVNFGSDYNSFKESIKNNGLYHPICVKYEAELTKADVQYYKLAAGRRRLKALTELGYETIPCKVYPAALSDQDVRIIELEENIRRKNLDWREEVELKKQIDDAYSERHGKKLRSSAKAIGGKGGGSGHSQEKTAELLNVSRATVSRDIKLAEALREMPELANCKTKKEAFQLLNKKTDEILAAEIARRAEVKRAKTEEEYESGSDGEHKYYDEGRSELITSYILGDTLEALPQMQSNCVSFIDLDWPYGIDLKGKLNLTDEQKQRLAGQQDLDLLAHQRWMHHIVEECHRILKPNAWLIVWHALDPWYPIIRDILVDVGFSTGPPAMWIKPSGHTRTPNCHLANCYEPFFYARKGEAVINKVGRQNTFSYGLPKSKVHPTEKPIELMQDIINTFTFEGANVMVPFAGSGNTILAAANLKRQAFGWDLDEAYRNQYLVKVQGKRPGEYTSY